MITQITFEYRTGMIKGTEEFADSLRTSYNVNEIPTWMPAAGGNYEMWFDIFLNTNLIDFLKGSIVGGAVYDIAKDKIFKPFIDSLNKLGETNDGALEIQKYRFYFQDAKVVVYGLANNFTSIFSAIFQELLNSFSLMENEIGVGSVNEIRIPVEPDSGRNEWWVGPEEIGPYLTYWGISVQHGLDNLVWDVQNKKFL